MFDEVFGYIAVWRNRKYAVEERRGHLTQHEPATTQILLPRARVIFASCRSDAVVGHSRSFHHRVIKSRAVICILLTVSKSTRAPKKTLELQKYCVALHFRDCLWRARGTWRKPLVALNKVKTFYKNQKPTVIYKSDARS